MVAIEPTEDLKFTFYLQYPNGCSYGNLGGVTAFNESLSDSMKVGIPSFEKTTGIDYCGKNLPLNAEGRNRYLFHT